MNKKGFTLVEVSLFITLSAAIFLATVLSVNGAISRQRYNDSVQSFYDFLVNVYSRTINVENSDGNGQAATAIYGKLISFTGTKPEDYKIVIYDITADADSFNTDNPLGLNNPQKKQSDISDYFTSWGAKINKNKTELFTGSVIIIRSANAGSISTYFSPRTDERIENIFAEATQTAIDFCIESDERNTPELANIRIAKNGVNASAIQWLTEGESRCR